jgi:hypothetical protein
VHRRSGTLATLLVCLLLPSAGASLPACGGGFSLDCNDAGCEDGVAFLFPERVLADATLPVRVTACVEDRCDEAVFSEAMVADGGFPFRVGVDLAPGTLDPNVPHTVSAVAVDARGRIVARHGPEERELRTYRPNGERCGPTCHNAGSFRVRPATTSR